MKETKKKSKDEVKNPVENKKQTGASPKNKQTKEKITMKSPEGERDKKIAMIIGSVVAVAAIVFLVYYYGFGGKYNGRYKLSAVTVMGMTVQSEDFHEVFGDDGYLDIIVKGEKCTFEGDLLDSVVGEEHKIIIDGENLTIDLAQGADFVGTYKDKKITIDMGGMYLIFEK